MARPRKDSPPDRFTSTELAVGADISARSLGTLIEAGLAPEAVENGPVGKKGIRLWDQYGVGETALIGAIHKGGAEIMAAAKIAHLIIDDFSSARGYLPSRFPEYLQRPLNPTPGKYPWDDVNPAISLRIDDDFWLHHLLRTKSSIYRPGIAIEGDMIMDIVDRRYVFTDFAYKENKVGRLNPWGITPAGLPDMALEIEGWERGRDAIIRPLHHIINFNFQDEAAKEKAREIEQSWLSAWRNAVGLLRVNVSLAIRNAFDAIHDHRLRAGTSFDWTATGNQKWEGPDTS